MFRSSVSKIIVAGVFVCGIGIIAKKIALKRKTQRINKISSDGFFFGRYHIPSYEIFFASQHCYCIVNYKPIVPGHVLICTKNIFPKLQDVPENVLCDLILTGQLVEKMLNNHYNTTSTTLCLQNGKDAGQTVEHIHLHILPRKPGDFKRNDEIYDRLEIEDKERKPRSSHEMEEEAKSLSNSMKLFINKENKKYIIF